MEGGTKLEWNKVFKEIILGKDKNVPQSGLAKEVSGKDHTFKQVSSKPKENKSPKCSIYPDNLLTADCAKRISQVQSLMKPSPASQTLEVKTAEHSYKAAGGPVWDEVFKDILGDKPLDEEVSKTEYIRPPVPHIPVKSRSFSSKKKAYHTSKSKADKDMEEVKKLFESWKLLKEPETEFSFNDFEGAGINIFNYSSQQKESFHVPKQNPPKPQSSNEVVNSCKHSDPKQFKKICDANNQDRVRNNNYRNPRRQKGFIPEPQQARNRYCVPKKNASKKAERLKPLKVDAELEECWDN